MKALVLRFQLPHIEDPQDRVGLRLRDEKGSDIGRVSAFLGTTKDVDLYECRVRKQPTLDPAQALGLEA